VTTANEVTFYDRAIRRIYILIPALGLGGALAICGVKGWQWGAGFLVGASAAFLNFRWLHQVVNALGRTSEPLAGNETDQEARPLVRRHLIFFLCIRYLLLGIGGYVILKKFGLGLEAALFGLLVPVAAAVSEILFELAHGA
jgi:hypothetical protein